jgi:hypothetical protein
MRLYIATLLILLTTLLHAQQFNAGTFSRQNPNAGYSVKETITLKADNTFSYEFDGHMIYEKAGGSFSMNTDHVITLAYDTLNQSDQNYREAIDMAPKKLKYTGSRLYGINKHGRKIKSTMVPSMHRRFYIFGDYWRKRKAFLKRVK